MAHRNTGRPSGVPDHLQGHNGRNKQARQAVHSDMVVDLFEWAGLNASGEATAHAGPPQGEQEAEGVNAPLAMPAGEAERSPSSLGEVHLPPSCNTGVSVSTYGLLEDYIAWRR